MAIYDKPISQITSPDLQELMDDEAIENIRLEFKPIWGIKGVGESFGFSARQALSLNILVRGAYRDLLSKANKPSGMPADAYFNNP